MKTFSLLPHVDLSEPMSSSEFVYREKYVNNHSMLLNTNAMFPNQKNMPIENPALSKDAGDRNYKFVSELTVLDRELLMLAQEHALKESQGNGVNSRRGIERFLQKRADSHAVLRERENLEFRILHTWIQRFHMEKLFHQLKIKTMDEFRHLMQLIHKRTDEQHRVQHKLYERQAGFDPGHPPSVAELNRRSGKEDEIIRLKINFDRDNLRTINDMRNILAEQQGSAALQNIKSAQRNVISAEKYFQRSEAPMVLRPPMLNKTNKVS